MSDIVCADAENGIVPANRVMTRSLLLSNVREVLSPSALVMTGAMSVGAVASVATKQVLFDGIPTVPVAIVVAALAFDVAAHFMPASRIAANACACTYAILYLSLASLAGVLFAYATQRLGMPLQDVLFAKLDRLMGIDWNAFTHWVDEHPFIAQALHASYETMAAQIILGAVGLSLLSNKRALRAYLLAFSLALMVTAVTSALLPALSPIATIDRSTYKILTFSGASPLNHLVALRSSGTALIHGDIGGIISFPSFHATVAVLTPMVLRRSWLALVILVPIDVMMLFATITEGAHYACDALAGAALAVAAHAFAVQAGDRWKTQGSNGVM